MDLRLLEKALECTSIPSLNRVAGTSYSSEDYFIEETKRELVKEACKFHDVELCSSEEDEILTIIEESSNKYSDKQTKIRNLLYRFGYNVKPLVPEFIKEYEENSDSAPIIRESKSHKPILEDDPYTNTLAESFRDSRIVREVQKEDLDDIINKISMCPDYSSLYYMEEEFNKLGMTIAQSNNKRVMLCTIGEDNRPKNTRIFEDYMFVGTSDNPNLEISSRVAECLMQFIKKAATAPRILDKTQKHWLENFAPYGDAFAVEQDRPTK